MEKSDIIVYACSDYRVWFWFESFEPGLGKRKVEHRMAEVLGLASFSLDNPPGNSALYRASFGVRAAFASIVASLGPRERLDLAQRLLEVQIHQLLAPPEAERKADQRFSAGRRHKAITFLYLPLASSTWPMLSRLLKDRKSSFCEMALTGLSNASKDELDQNRATFRHRLSILKAACATSTADSEAQEVLAPPAPASAAPVDADSSLDLACWTHALSQGSLTNQASELLIEKTGTRPVPATAVLKATIADEDRSVEASANARPPRQSGKLLQAGTALNIVHEQSTGSDGDPHIAVWERKAASLLTLTRVLAPDEFVARELRLAALCTMIVKWTQRSPEVLKLKHLCHQVLPAGPLREQHLILRATVLCHLFDGAWDDAGALTDLLPPLPATGSARTDAIDLHAAVYRKLVHFDFDGARQRRRRYDLFRAQLAQLPQADRDALLGPLLEAFAHKD